MKVEIWSDVVCPWCYIGKRRFESALAEFEHRDDVEVVWRSFQLDPSAPQSANTTVSEHLAGKLGISLKQAEAMNAHVSELAAQEGLDYHLENAKYSNTFDAHRLIHLAAKHGLQDVVKERLMKGYFTESAAVGDYETLIKLVSEAGVDADEARAVLASDTYANEVRADIQRARSFGISGVPFFAIDERYGISGAQPAEGIREVLEQAWADAHPLIKISAGGKESGVCEDDSCAV
ncbi:MAG: DsbA family oxidoreductase [Chloroflexota bacterium]